MCIFLLFGLSMFLCVPPGPTQYIFHTPMTRYSLFVLKVSLNTNKPNQPSDTRVVFSTVVVVGSWLLAGKMFSCSLTVDDDELMR